MTLASVTERIGPAVERVRPYIGPAKEKLYEGATCARDAVSKGAQTAYRAALENPKTSIGAIIVAAALVGGVLWYMFRDRRKPASHRSPGTRVRAGAERRRRSHRAARAAAA